MKEIKGSRQTREEEVVCVKAKAPSHLVVVTVHLALLGLCDLMY